MAYAVLEDFIAEGKSGVEKDVYQAAFSKLLTATRKGPIPKAKKGSISILEPELQRLLHEYPPCAGGAAGAAGASGAAGAGAACTGACDGAAGADEGGGDDDSDEQERGDSEDSEDVEQHGVSQVIGDVDYGSENVQDSD
jgi:hypothetical protein